MGLISQLSQMFRKGLKDSEELRSVDTIQEIKPSNNKKRIRVYISDACIDTYKRLHSSKGFTKFANSMHKLKIKYPIEARMYFKENRSTKKTLRNFALDTDTIAYILKQSKNDNIYQAIRGLFYYFTYGLVINSTPTIEFINNQNKNEQPKKVIL